MFSNILLPIDINDKKSWKPAFNRIIDFYKIIPQCKFTIIYIVQTYGLGMLEDYFPKGWAKEVIKKSTEKLHDIVAKNLPPEIKVEIIVDKGVVYQAIIDYAEKMEADLIVISALNPERSDYLLGPNVAKVVRHSNTSVLVTRE